MPGFQASVLHGPPLLVPLDVPIDTEDIHPSSCFWCTRTQSAGPAFAGEHSCIPCYQGKIFTLWIRHVYCGRRVQNMLQDITLCENQERKLCSWAIRTEHRGPLDAVAGRYPDPEDTSQLPENCKRSLPFMLIHLASEQPGILSRAVLPTLWHKPASSS